MKKDIYKKNMDKFMEFIQKTDDSDKKEEKTDGTNNKGGTKTPKDTL